MLQLNSTPNPQTERKALDVPEVRNALGQFLESPLKTFAIYFIVVDEIGGWNNNPDIYANRVSRTNLRLLTPVIELVTEAQGWTTPYNNRLELYKTIV